MGDALNYVIKFQINRGKTQVNFNIINKASNYFQNICYSKTN